MNTKKHTEDFTKQKKEEKEKRKEKKQVEAEFSQAQLHWRLAKLEFHHCDEKLSIKISFG